MIRPGSSGSAYVFPLDGTSWTEKYHLLASDRAAGDWFGESVSIDRDRVVVGAAHNDDNADDAGSAYVYTLSSGTTDVDGLEDGPQFALRQLYPNPLIGATTISFDLAQPSDARLTVYDVLGREVSMLASGHRPAGTYEVSFDATGLPSGVYFYRLQAGSFVGTKRVVVVR